MKFFLPFLMLMNFAQAKSVTYKVDGLSYEGHIEKRSPEAPVVFLIHDWDGLTEYEVKRAKMLRGLGYSVFAADLFGKGIRPTKVKDKRQHTGELFKDRAKMRRLLRAAKAEAEKAGLNTKKIMAMGYCFGGAAVLEWARSGDDLFAFASFHGGLGTPKKQNYKKTKGKVLVFHGTADKMIKMSHFAKLADQLEKDGADHEMITYAKAPHAFTVFGSERYRENADRESWARFTKYLKDSL